MSVKEITPDMKFATEEQRADLLQMVERVSAFLDAALETRTYQAMEFTRPELCAVLAAAKQADKILFALTPTQVYLLHLPSVKNGVLLVEVAESDVQGIGGITLLEENTNG